MLSLSLVLLVAAAVLLFVAAFGVVFSKLNLMCLGLALWALSQLVARVAT